MHLKAALNPLGLRSLPKITASTLFLFLPTLPRHTPQSLESGGVRWGGGVHRTISQQGCVKRC